MQFRLCGLMFLFIPLGMFTALLLYRRLTALLARLPLPGIVPKGMVLDDFETNLKLVLSGWYAIYFQFLVLLGPHSFQRCHARVFILVCVVGRIGFS
jgi:hypothetical protein